VNFHRTPLYATILLLIYPSQAAIHQDILEPPAFLDESNGNLTEPVLLEQVTPPYTEEARKARVEGVVVLQCIVRKDGNVDSCKVIRSIGYGLDELAIKSIETKWRFKPATREGKPVDFDAHIEVSFQIYKGEQVRTDDASVQFILGMKYLQGDGVPQDYKEAEKWLGKAAEQGNTSAQCMLGTIYAAGLGLIKDPVQAHMWLTLSIDGSKGKQAPFLQKATELRNSLAKNMTPQQIEEAQSLASEWKPVTPVPKSIPKQIGGNVLKSKLIKQVTPKYPEAAKRQRISGMVILIVTVNEEGNVTNIRVTRGHDLLADAAIEAVKQWEYSPTLFEGKPIPVTATVTVNFVLGGR